MKIAVCIPIYKPYPTNDEQLSLRQCLSVLCAYDTLLVCPQDMDVSPYEICAGRGIDTLRFQPHYFQGIKGYNKLMKSHCFYRSVCQYDYILIYQLDAWVFSDQLMQWAAKGYDYVGAPWFQNHGTHEEGKELWMCGNGGLSLRKVQKFFSITSPYYRWMPNRENLYDLLHHKKRNRKLHMWEDTFFCYGLMGTPRELHLPTALEAASFAFECSPSYLFKLTGNQLPFGCHAWRKYEFETFWKNYISIPQEKEKTEKNDFK